jgi:hypothetical protein
MVCVDSEPTSCAQLRNPFPAESCALMFLRNPQLATTHTFPAYPLRNTSGLATETAWGQEDVPADEATLPRLRISAGHAPELVYPDESSADRDRNGILWRRAAWAPGEGRALFARVHVTRQHRVMHFVLWGKDVLQ